MENTSFNNYMGLSNVKIDSSGDVAIDKLNRVYEMYVAKRYADAVSAAEGDSNISNTPYGQVLIGNCYKEMKNRAQALVHWKKAIELSPLEYNAYINIANDAYQDGKIEEAILNWSIASTIVPENSTVNLNLALAYDKKGSRIKATKYFERYLKYEKNIASEEYLHIKNVMTMLTAKVDFFSRKVDEFKVKKDLKMIAALYLKMVSTYANLPNIYANIAEIFYFDKNYEKALEFFLAVYLNYPHTTKILLDVANLCFILQKHSYAFAYYSRAIKLLPEGTSYYTKVCDKLKALSFVLNDTELIDSHLQLAREAEADNDYERAIDEYENYIILTESEHSDLQQIIDKYKIFVHPEPFVVSVLYGQINELMQDKKLELCVEVCDRILKMATGNSKEVVFAMKCKTECKRIMLAREQFGVF